MVIQEALDHRHLLPVTEGHAFSYVFLFYADAAYEAFCHRSSEQGAVRFTARPVATALTPAQCVENAAVEIDAKNLQHGHALHRLHCGM